MSVTASGLTATALAAITASVVTGCTLFVAIIGWLIDRSAARHERTRNR
jgi:hypothetical protein